MSVCIYADSHAEWARNGVVLDGACIGELTTSLLHYYILLVHPRFASQSVDKDHLFLASSGGGYRRLAGSGRSEHGRTFTEYVKPAVIRFNSYVGRNFTSRSVRFMYVQYCEVLVLSGISSDRASLIRTGKAHVMLTTHAEWQKTYISCTGRGLLRSAINAALDFHALEMEQEYSEDE